MFIIDRNNKIVAANFADWKAATVERLGEDRFRIWGNEANGSEYEFDIAGGARLQDSSGNNLANLFALRMAVEKTDGDEFATEIWKTAMLSLLGILLGSTTVSVLVLRRSLMPLAKLTQAAETLQSGTIPDPIHPQGSTELRRLISAFNSATETMSKTDLIRQQFISDIAHEFRTPLTNVRSTIEAFESGLMGDRKELIEIVQSETSLLQRLVEDFQQLALSDSGKMKVHVRPIPLLEIVELSFHNFKDKSNGVLNTDIPDTMQVLADPDRLRQVFGNLYENSFRYCSDAKITMHARRQENCAVILLTDNGPGVAGQHRLHVFERFYRADNSRSRQTGGAGLGLAICKSLIEAMDGTISLQDNDHSVGVCFEIKLPLSQS